ncbi:MAG TPA: ADOP family duplicated permease, partial [Gemmatimonadaceae bacterium]
TTNRNNHSLQVVARLKAGVDSGRAAAGLNTLARQLEIAYPATNKGRTLLVTSVMGGIVGSVRPALLTLFAAAGLVLLIACANVGNLALVRGIARRREIAIRTALGAERFRLIRQLLTENLLIGVIGGVLGLALSWLTLQALMGSTTGILPRREGIGLDLGVLAFAMGLSMLTGVVIGLLPALGASPRSLHADLSDGTPRASASGARRRLLETFVGVEIVLSVLLLTGAGLAIRSFAALLSVDPGFSTEGVLTFAINAPPRAMDDTSLSASFYLPIRDRLRQIPGVRQVAMISTLPVAGGTSDRFFQIVGKPANTDPMTRPDGEIRVISDGYFRAMGIRIIGGREFSDADIATSPRVAVINRELAKRYFGGEDPIGHSIEINTGELWRIVGVVQSVREVGLDQPERAEFYLPVTQSRENTSATSFVLATSAAPEAVVREVRDAVRLLAQRQPLYQLATMHAVVQGSLGRQRLLFSLLGAFAILALVLAAAGVFGVMSYGVAQRRREIGIRIALGARLGNVTAMVMGDAARVIGAALVVGLGAALLATRAMAAVLYGVTTHDAMTFVAAPLLIGFVALVAGAVPALRAARTDPLIAMRTSD